MSTPNPYESIVRFSVFELDFPGRVLLKSGIRMRCQEQPLQVLAALLDRPGVLVTREELRRRVWPEDTFVDFDHALNTAVKKLRNVLNDDADTPRFIETVPRRGYRFIAPIQESQIAVALPPAAKTPEILVPDAQESHYLRAFLIASLAVVFAWIAIYYFSSRHAKASGGPASSRPAMLAVLPFQNMTNDPAQESFSDGMTEETITRLARANSARFHVIARTSAMKYKNTRKGVDEIANELHADYLLEGSIRREGPYVRISCQLIRAADQSPRWSQEYNYDSGDPLTLESDAAETIVKELNSVLGDPSVHPYSMKDNAFDSYLRGLAESSIHTPEGLDRIIATFEKAVADDPNCAQPLAGLAHVYERGVNLGFLPPRPTYAKARAAAERAIQLDPSLPEAHAYLADALLTVDYDWNGAQVEIQKALELNANDPMAHEWNGIFLSLQNKIEPAVEEMQRAVELDPLNADRKIFLGEILFQAGHREQSEEQLKAALQLDPASDLAHAILVYVYTRWGRQDDAIKEWSTLFFLSGQPESANSIKSVYRKSGFEAARRFGNRAELAELTHARETRYVSPMAFAMVYARLGDKERAISWIEKAYDARDASMPCLLNTDDATFASVKNDPRVVSVLEKIRPQTTAR
jgi:TolB-like protein/DNA-binding winged helix-turn-helix (wHTH) protein/cytochrome c-type biogenesis protein CcmH/NrfG